MRKVREVLRLHFAAELSIRAIARSLGSSPSTVGGYLRRAKLAGLSWPLPASLDEAGLERRLFPAPPSSRAPRPLPDWSRLHRELRRKGVTLSLLWEEYKAVHPEGLQYSRFCEQYRAWAAKLDLVMRQEHRAGEKLFVDYAGQTASVVDPETGEARPAQVFVAVLGASSYTFAEATWPQTLGVAAGDAWVELNFSESVELAGERIEQQVERLRELVPAGEVEVNAAYVRFASGQVFLDWIADSREPFARGDVEQGP